MEEECLNQGNVARRTNMLNTDKYIYKIEDSDSNNTDLTEYPTGWYFSDETEHFNGPYISRQEALDSLEAYAKWLNQ